jgi:glyoxylase-like metal-dependent hydrolase (beta-lactamase superfamily II)
MNTSSAFSRRAFLATVPAALAASRAFAEGSPSPAPVAKPMKNSIIYRFTIGDIEAFAISDGTLRFGSPQVLMYPEDQREKMKEALIEEGEPTDCIPCYINTLVLRWGKEVVVIDPGFGGKSRPKFGWMFDALPQLGITNDQVTAGFLSHAHIDHIGGFVADGKPTFPNAALHVLQSELDFWFTKEPDFSESHRNPQELPGLIKGNREKFEILKPQTQAMKGGEALLDGRITIEAAPGHTAGHAIFRISSKGETVLHIADLVHHPVLMFRNPNWFVGLDHHPKAAVESRKKVFAQAAAEHTRIFAFHLSWPGLGRIAKLGDGYRWLPERAHWDQA